jgi:hypothetical protein
MEEPEYRARGVTAFDRVSLGTYPPQIYSAFRWQWSMQKRQRSVKHGVIGSIEYTLGAAISIQKELRIVECDLGLLQTISNQVSGLIVFQRFTPSMFTA